MFLKSNDVSAMSRYSNCRDGGVKTMSLFRVSSLFWVMTPEAAQLVYWDSQLQWGLYDQYLVISISKEDLEVCDSKIAVVLMFAFELWSWLPFDSGVSG